MTEERLGVYDFGVHRFEVFTTDGDDGGYYYLRPANGAMPKIVCSLLDIGSGWPGVLGTLIHEAFEAVSSLRRLRFEPAPCDTLSMDRFVFMMTHAQFSELCSCVAAGVSKIIPDLEKRFNELNNKG